MSPPGGAPAPPIGGSTNTESPTVEDLIRTARLILDQAGVSMSQAKLSRTVRTFKHRVERNGFSFLDFLGNRVRLTAEQRRRALANPEIARVIAYADPTGETATTNVMRERRTSHRKDRP